MKLKLVFEHNEKGDSIHICDTEAPDLLYAFPDDSDITVVLKNWEEYINETYGYNDLLDLLIKFNMNNQVNISIFTCEADCWFTLLPREQRIRGVVPIISSNIEVIMDMFEKKHFIEMLIRFSDD